MNSEENFAYNESINIADDNKVLKETVLNLIKNSGREEYWDFKVEHHKDKARLLHDILCLANTFYDGPKFIIFGVNDEREIVGLQYNPDFTQHKILDWYSKIKFEGGIYPDIKLRSISITDEGEAKTLDVLIIVTDKNKKPYYLREAYPHGKSCQENSDKAATVHPSIYSRIECKNTPISGCIGINELEKIFKQRFALDMPQIERYKYLLKEPENWEFIDVSRENWHNDNEEIVSYFYHKNSPEFKIKIISYNLLTDAPITTTSESYVYFYCDHVHGSRYTFDIEIIFEYFGTNLLKLSSAKCAAGAVIIPKPDVDIFQEKYRFFSYTMGNYNEMLKVFLDKKLNIEYSSKLCNFICFDNKDQKNMFINHLNGLSLDAINSVTIDDEEKLNSFLEESITNITQEKIENEKMKTKEECIFFMRIYSVYSRWKMIS